MIVFKKKDGCNWKRKEIKGFLEKKFDGIEEVLDEESSIDIQKHLKKKDDGVVKGLFYDLWDRQEDENKKVYLFDFKNDYNQCYIVRNNIPTTSEYFEAVYDNFEIIAPVFILPDEKQIIQYHTDEKGQEIINIDENLLEKLTQVKPTGYHRCDNCKKTSLAQTYRVPNEWFKHLPIKSVDVCYECLLAYLFNKPNSIFKYISGNW